MASCQNKIDVLHLLHQITQFPSIGNCPIRCHQMHNTQAYAPFVPIIGVDVGQNAVTVQLADDPIILTPADPTQPNPLLFDYVMCEKLNEIIKPGEAEVIVRKLHDTPISKFPSLVTDELLDVLVDSDISWDTFQAQLDQHAAKRIDFFDFSGELK